MAIAPTLQKYLDQNVTYEVIPHEPTLSSMRTADSCHISGDGLAKGIVLRRDEGYMLAVLPASHHIRLSDLRRQIGNDVDLASEMEIDQLFRDCAHGAVPRSASATDWTSLWTTASRSSRTSIWSLAITRRYFT
jgi:Ala-tRNA(Pro) deacylase